MEKCPQKEISMSSMKYDIVWMDSDDSDELECVGKYSPARAMIRVPDYKKNCQIAQTMIHEILHMIEHFMAVSTNAITPEQKQEEQEENERYIEAMSNGICLFLKENPSLVLWLLKILGASKKDLNV